MLCLVLSFLCGTSVRGAQPDKEIDRLAKAYRAERTNLSGELLCLDAIDAGVSRRSFCAVGDAIFARLRQEVATCGAGLHAGFVDFHPLRRRRPADARFKLPTSAGILRQV